MDIRQAVFADTLRLSSLCMDVQRLHAEHHPDVFQMPESEDFAISFFEEMLADPAVRIFIADENGESVGYILCKLVERPVNPFTFAARSLHVDQISVRPASRQHGVGLALMQRAEMLAQEWDVQRIQLDSWDFNINAHAFFERMGFQKFNFRFWRKL
ncbi:MAG: N-acetyltransferase family protein [Limisphaerales bacterium]